MDNTEQKIFGRVVHALAKQGITAMVTARAKKHRVQDPDGVLQLKYAGKKFTRAVEIKRHLMPATIGAVQAQLRHHPDNPLLVTNYVTPQLADQLREYGIQFVDTAGNAYIQTDDLLIWTKGHRPAARHHEAEPTGRAFEPTGLKIVFALLCDPARVALPYRTLAQLAGVAHGTVGWAMADLAKRGFIARLQGDAQRRRLVQIDRLLAQWAEAYARVLRPKLLLARFRRAETTAPIAARGEPDFLLGGEAAAAQITGYLKPATLTFYGEAPDNRWIVRNRLVADPRGDVELLLRFWRFQTPEEAQRLVPLPLIYADLLAIGDPRTLETAQLIREKILARLEP